MKIGELATRSGLSTKTIRYYESIGLIPEPERTAGGYRQYDAAAIDRLRFIRDAQSTGLSLAEIASVLELRDHGESTCHHILELLERHLAHLDAHIKTLVATRARLSTMTETARSLDPAECHDPVRCQTIVPGGAGADTRLVHGAPVQHDHT